MVATQGLRDSGWCQAVCGLNRHTAENVGAEMRRQLWWTWARCPASVCLSLFICRLGEAVRTSWHMGTCPARPTSVTGGQCVLCTHGSDHSGHATRGLNPGYRLQGTGWPSQRDGGRSQEKLRGGVAEAQPGLHGHPSTALCPATHPGPVPPWTVPSTRPVRTEGAGK